MKKFILIFFVGADLLFFPAKLVARQLTFEPDKTSGSLVLLYENERFPVETETVQAWLGPIALPRYSNLIYQPPPSDNLLKQYLGQGSQTTGDTDLVKLGFRPALIYQFIKETAITIDSPPVEPQLTIQNNRATSFIPSQNGLKVDIFQTTMDILRALTNNEKEIKMTVAITLPHQSLFGTNDLGIKELVGRGESNFKGSPKNRKHNIKVGIEKFRGIILKPGEEFSFNKFLGPVEKEEGFLPELVIKKDGTKPELGGGLCQVSSTTFRAAVQAGLPIKERKNHAYAVVYYSPQGTDATIYPGSVDLKFINDTPAHLLIWPYLKDDNNLVFDFYGTKDDRQILIHKPIQYDKKEDGSMKATWEREVTKNGETKKDVFKSVYLSPSLFHKEETFVSASSTPQTNLSPQNTTQQQSQ